MSRVSYYSKSRIAEVGTSRDSGTGAGQESESRYCPARIGTVGNYVNTLVQLDIGDPERERAMSIHLIGMSPQMLLLTAPLAQLLLRSTSLCEHLIKRTIASEQRKLQRLFNTEELGGRKPSHAESSSSRESELAPQTALTCENSFCSVCLATCA